MKNLVNHVQLIGNLGMDPELKEFDKNKLARFSMATNESYKNQQGEWVNDTTWHNIVAWGKMADNIVNKLKKGSRIALNGKLNNRSYETSEGEKKYICEVILQDYMIIPKKEAETAEESPF
ncbi:MAG: single-stranded DNA-binding protein [Bacteroidetes bacterium]|jgi:single-strand DNA-binding protein|nr:single-stranded DNA-binding protein [Bacteroidota bacterium]